MRRKQHISYLLMLMLTLAGSYAFAQKKPIEVVSDEKQFNAADYDSARAQKARLKAERKKKMAERSALNSVSDENPVLIGTPTPSQQDMPVQEGSDATPANSQTQDAPRTRAGQNDDLPVDPSAIEEEAAQQPAIAKPATTKAQVNKAPAQQNNAVGKPTNDGPKDYESVKMFGIKANEEENKNKDYSIVKMATPPSLDSLKKAGAAIPGNAVDRKATAYEGIGGKGKNKKLSDSVFIMMERTPCKARPCASYRIDIFYNGRVEYTGYNGVQMKGDYTTMLPKAILRNIFNLAKDAKFYSLQDAYIDENAETAIQKQVTNVVMQVKGKRKLVKDGQTDTPSELVFLEKYIDDVLEDAIWKAIDAKSPRILN